MEAGLEGFTPTSVDGQQVTTEQPKADEPIHTQDEVQQDQNQEQQSQLQPESQQAIDQSNAQQSSEQEVLNKPAEAGEQSFEASTVDFDTPKEVEGAPQQPIGGDLLTFLDEHNELIQEYNSLNQNFDEMKPEDLIKEHLASQHPNLTSEDLDALMSDYSYDEESDERATIVRKKIATQEAADKAKNFFDTRADAVRQELAKRQLGGPSQNTEQVQQHREAVIADFNQQTDNFFGEGFDGFDFQLNDQKNLHLKINNKEAIRNTQASIDTFLGNFFDAETNKVTDAAGYHKAIFAAMNMDAIARNSYEQGKTDAITQQAAEMKNIDMGGRPTHDSIPTEGTKWTIT